MKGIDEDAAPTDPVMLRIMLDSFAAIPEEMGRALRRTAHSPNIKERMDASCALFDGEGNLLAQAEHIPVHLGSMPLVVKEVLKRFPDLGEGDAVVVNDPACGGTHLPDLTMVMPVMPVLSGMPVTSVASGIPLIHCPRPVAFVANRAHHADIGGMSPGSMPADSRELHQEGLIIPPVHIMTAGNMNTAVMDLILANTRTPTERAGDIMAQLSACHLGCRRVRELVERYGPATFHDYSRAVLDHSHRLARHRRSSIPPGIYTAREIVEMDTFGEIPGHEDPVTGEREGSVGSLDLCYRGGDPAICLAVRVTDAGIEVDFTGTSREVDGNLNAPPAVAMSAVSFALRCLLGADIPHNDGAIRDINVILPGGSLLNPSRNRAVCSGNVETSQRIVEALFSALSEALPHMIPAGSQGTMNNVVIGGSDFSYYETLGGGEGAHPWRDGESGIHTGMTNTANTPVEAIELAYPLRIRQYSLVQESGGSGRFTGGLGLCRSIEILTESARLSILSGSRRTPPRGRNGGKDGRPGRNMLHRGRQVIPLPGMASTDLQMGDVVVIETPGGAGWGVGTRLR